MKLILIRHGEIDSNVKKVYSGRSNEPLNENGRHQALASAEHLKNIQIGALFTSPLQRTVETARVIGEKISLVPVVSEAFNELRMGPWEGLSEVEVAEQYPAEFALWNSKPADLNLPGRETLAEIQYRAIAGVFEAFALSNKSTIAVVTHVAVIRVLLLCATNRPLNDYKSIHVPNAIPLSLDVDHAKWQ